MSWHSRRNAAIRTARPFSFILGAAFITAAAPAIVIRHDIPDAAYLAKESDFPALFGIYRTKDGHKECIATVISQTWAVTAAHCAREKRLLDAAGPSGKGYSVEVAGRATIIDRVMHHPGTGGGRAPDIALLRFASPVTHVAPVPIYSDQDELGRIIVMPGWGGTGTGKTGLAPEDGLFRVAENIVDRAEEGRLWWKFDAPGPNSKALTLEGISGPGDSGGPALIRTPRGWAVAGISSAQDTMGGPEGLYGVEEVFVRASEFAEWIDGHLVLAGSATAATAAPSLRYDVTLLPQARSLFVDMKITNGEVPQEWSWSPGETSPPSLLQGATGTPRMAYVAVIPEQTTILSHKPELDQSGLRSWGYPLFRIPVLSETPQSIEVCFTLPAGWAMVTSQGPLVDCIRPQDTDSLLKTGFIAAPAQQLAVRQFHIGQSNVVLAHPTDYPVPGEVLQSQLSRLIAAARSYVGSLGPPKVFFYIEQADDRPLDAPGNNYTTANTSSTFLVEPASRDPNDPGLWGTFAHEFLHTWTPWAFGDQAHGELGPTFSEGITNYLGYRVAFEAGLHSEQQLAAAISNYYLEYLRVWMPDIEQQREGVLPYSQGFLAALVLDFELLRATKGKAGFREFIRKLTSRHAGNESLTKETFLAELASIGGQSATDLYVRLTDTRQKIDFSHELRGTGLRLQTPQTDDVKAARREKRLVVFFQPASTPERRLLRQWLAR